MARPSKLDERQKAEILRRRANGETAGALAKEFGLSKSRFHALFTGQVETVQKLATTLAATETEIARLPISGQVSVYKLADHLRGIGENMAEASGIHAKNAKRLAELAQMALDKVDPAAMQLGLESAKEDINQVMRLTTVSNEAGKMPMGLITANKNAADAGKQTLEDLILGGK